MKFGLHLPNFGPYSDPRVLADLAYDAEKAGWQGFFIWDHIARHHTVMVDPWIALAAAACMTTSIRLGTMITPIPRRRPHILAKQTVSLDVLSQGRVTLGVGSGPSGEEFANFGDENDPRKRGAMLDEGLAVIDGLWSGKPFSFTGEHYFIDNITYEPKPMQQPRIPVWCGAKWPNKKPLRRAALWDGVFPVFATGDMQERLDGFRGAVNYVKEQRGDNSAPFDYVVNGQTKSNEAAGVIAPFKAAGATWWLENIEPNIGGGANHDLEWPLDAMRDRILQGPPDLA